MNSARRHAPGGGAPAPIAEPGAGRRTAAAGPAGLRGADHPAPPAAADRARSGVAGAAPSTAADLVLPTGAEFLAPLAERARRGDVLVTRDPDPRDPEQRPDRVRRSAVLIHLAGTRLEEAALVIEERGHRMRSQPGQFSLPGGGRDETDRDDVHTALREAREETGMDAADVEVIGAFASIPMPWRLQRVTPVLSWSPQRLPLRVQDPVEVERVLWAPLMGPGSLTDPAHRLHGVLGGRGVGPAFDLPHGAFVWGFTAMIIEQVIIGLGLDPVPADAPMREIPAERRR